MTAKTLDRFQVGTGPAHSVELLQLDDGRYQVVLALTPPEDEWESDSYPPPGHNFRDYDNKVEAEAWFKTVKRMLSKMGAPGAG